MREQVGIDQECKRNKRKESERQQEQRVLNISIDSNNDIEIKENKEQRRE